MSPLVPFAWAIFVGVVFSTIGAAGGILAAVGHITILGVADANVVKPMSQLLVIVSPLVSVPASWRQRRLVIAVALLIGGGAVAGALLGSWSSIRYLGTMRDYRLAFGVLTLLIAARLWYETTARFRERHARLRDAAAAFERAYATGAAGARAETRWRFPALDVVLAGHRFPLPCGGVDADGPRRRLRVRRARCRRRLLARAVSRELARAADVRRRGHVGARGGARVHRRRVHAARPSRAVAGRVMRSLWRRLRRAPAEAIPRVEIYGARDCCLCDDAKAVLARVRADVPFELSEIDIASSPEREATMRERIPLVTIDGRLAFKYTIDEAALRRRLSKGGRR